MTSTRFRLALALLIALSVAGCAGSPTAPRSPQGGSTFTRALVNRDSTASDSARYTRALVNFSGEPDSTEVPDPATP